MSKFILLLILPTCLFAQKRAEQTFDAKDIKALYINSDAVFKISIATQAIPEISVSTLIDGETYESSLVHIQRLDQRLEISTGRTPDFTPFNDKLSAHKVLSIELEIVIPEQMDVTIRSTLAETQLVGQFNNLQIDLGRGGLIGKEIRFRESAINTISGNVTLSLRAADVIAGSRNGTSKVDSIFNDGPLCVIQSIYGDIEVLQVK